MKFRRLLIAVTMCISAISMFAADDTTPPTPPQPDCSALPTASQLKGYMTSSATQSDSVIGGTVGGLFAGTRMWGAVVNRDGVLCAVVASQNDPTQVWPGSQAIAKAKAYTANAFSVDTLPLSTARLYTFTQPGHSLASLGQSNLFDPQFLATPGAAGDASKKVNGGLIFFGGGVPLYKEGKVVGGLGVSGDTACADHEIAKRVRNLAALNPPAGPKADDIVYSSDGQTFGYFIHPKCLNTYRNGEFIGNEAAARDY